MAAERAIAAAAQLHQTLELSRTQRWEADFLIRAAPVLQASSAVLIAVVAARLWARN